MAESNYMNGNYMVTRSQAAAPAQEAPAQRAGPPQDRPHQRRRGSHHHRRRRVQRGPDPGDPGREERGGAERRGAGGQPDEYVSINH